MKTCLQTFKTGIQELQAFLATIEHESELTGLLLQRKEALNDLEKQLLSQIASARTDQKRYVYTVAIVSLYGLLERYIDTLIETFVHRITSLVSSYELMPEAIQKNHVQFSMDLIKAISEDRHRKNTTQEDVIANLHSCFSGKADFRINGAAFVLHRGNISLQKIRDFLSSVGINAHLRRVVLASEMLDFFKQRNLERDLSRVPDQELEPLLDPIDDLVERRNQVSHGVINIDDIESIDLLKERCNFVASFGGALYDLMLQEVLKYQIDFSSTQKLGKPIAVFNSSIVCFENDNCKIAVGNVLAAATGNTQQPFRYSYITGVEIDRKAFTTIAIEESTKFGLKVSFKANEQYDYYVLPAEVI
jgi:hypothetical protein